MFLLCILIFPIAVLFEVMKMNGKSEHTDK